MKYLRRLIWYIVARLFVISILISLFAVVFYTSMNMSNIYIVIKDGMAKRAQLVMAIDDNTDDLSKYFNKSYIQKDKLISLVFENSSPYSWYKIRGIDHRINIRSMQTWPWDNKAYVTFEESIPKIDGNILSKYKPIILAQDNEKALNPPRWNAGKYKATLIHTSGKWVISELENVK